jgi:hypothetical protein
VLLRKGGSPCAPSVPTERLLLGRRGREGHHA